MKPCLVQFFSCIFPSDNQNWNATYHNQKKLTVVLECVFHLTIYLEKIVLILSCQSIFQSLAVWQTLQHPLLKRILCVMLKLNMWILCKQWSLSLLLLPVNTVLLVGFGSRKMVYYYSDYHETCPCTDARETNLHSKSP